MPLTFQVTDVFAVFCTVAVNCFVCFTRTVALVGEIVMATAGGAAVFAELFAFTAGNFLAA